MLLSSSNRKYPPFPLLSYFSMVVCQMFVTSYSVTYCIYIPGKPGICFHYHCAVYDECKYSDTFCLEDRIRLFVHTQSHYHHCANLSEDFELYKMSVRYILSSVSKIRHILSVIHYTIRGAVCFQFTQFPSDDWENVYTLSYYHQ